MAAPSFSVPPGIIMPTSTQTMISDTTRPIAEVENAGHAALSEAPPASWAQIHLPGLQNYKARLRYASRKGKCNHSTMSRIYQDAYPCESCGGLPRSGWLYRCIEDRDRLIIGAKAQGYRVFYDAIGASFAEDMSLGLFGPDARSHPASFFDEVTTEQMRSYTASQLATVLSQRENVHRTIARERERSFFPYPNLIRSNYPDDDRPWMPDEKLECQYTVCGRCHSQGRDKSWVSLNGVLNGDILPTVAVGFAHGYFGARPVVDANLVKQIGYRAVPLPQGHPARTPHSSIDTSVSSRKGRRGQGVPRASGFSGKRLSIVLEEPDSTDQPSPLSLGGALPEESCDGASEHSPACFTLPPVDGTLKQASFSNGVPFGVTEGVAQTEEAAEPVTAGMAAYLRATG
ncbi:hypothetical protein VTK26DRAFT_2434 [Humicola hyalothermophila]